MKIEKLHNNKIITFKPRQIQNQATQVNQKETFFSSPINPEFYQAQLGILKNYLAIPQADKNGDIFSIVLHMPISGMGDDDKVILDINQEDSINVFLDKNGDLNHEILNFFVNNYIKEFEQGKQKFEQEQEILVKILNEKPKSLKIYSPEDIQEEPELPLEKSLRQILNYEERILSAARVLNRNENIYKKSIHTIGQELINIIKLSLDDEGNFDASELEYKKQIAKRMTLYSQIYEFDWANVILEYCRDKNGKIDLSYCDCLTNILISCIDDEDVETRIFQASIVVRKIMEQYPQNYENIIKNMIIQFTTGEENIFV